MGDFVRGKHVIKANCFLVVEVIRSKAAQRENVHCLKCYKDGSDQLPPVLGIRINGGTC